MIAKEACVAITNIYGNSFSASASGWNLLYQCSVFCAARDTTWTGANQCITCTITHTVVARGGWQWGLFPSPRDDDANSFHCQPCLKWARVSCRYKKNAREKTARFVHTRRYTSFLPPLRRGGSSCRFSCGPAKQTPDGDDEQLSPSRRAGSIEGEHVGTIGGRIAGQWPNARLREVHMLLRAHAPRRG